MIPVRENSEVVIIYPEFTWDYIHIVNIFVKMVDNVVYLSQHYPGEKSTLIIFLSVEACVFLLGGSDESWWRYWLLMDWGNHKTIWSLIKHWRSLKGEQNCTQFFSDKQKPQELGCCSFSAGTLFDIFANYLYALEERRFEDHFQDQYQ